MKDIINQDVEVVLKLLNQTLSVDDFADIERLGGLTNHTYRVTLKDGSAYVVRIPGEGTEQMIVREDERISTELACRLGIDAKLLHFGKEGAKITEYIPNAVTMSAQTISQKNHIEQVAAILKKIHHCGEDTGVLFEVFKMATNYEKIICDMNVPMFSDYDDNKVTVMKIKEEIDREIAAPKVPCHNDPLCENWIEGDGRMYLIDWEYAGMNDGMWDVADVSIEANFDDANDEILLTSYLDRTPSILDRKHFLASKIYVDYLWTLWAKARVPYDGHPMEDWAAERYDRMKTNISKFNKIQEDIK